MLLLHGVDSIGRIEVRGTDGGRGTPLPYRARVVAPAAPPDRNLAMPASSTSAPATPPLLLSAKARRSGEQPISFLMAAALANPDLISFAAGFVDPLTLPVEDVRAIAASILADPVRARAALQYDTTLGLAPLRAALRDHLATLDGVAPAFAADQVLVTTGSQQALYLAAQVLLDPGDIVLVEAPSYFVYTAALASFGARCIGIPMDEGGMRIDLLERELHQLDRDGLLRRVKAVYTVDYFQNPTGLTLSAERRPRLLEVVRRFSRDHRIVILEDAAYRELNYDAAKPPPRSIHALDREGTFVAYFGTFSKPFAPGIKTGYAVLPRDLLAPVLDQKGNHDFGSPSFSQHVALAALRDGRYAEHLRVLRAGYRAKRDAMVAALRTHMPAGVRWTEPDGGLYVWLTLGEDADTSRPGVLFDAAVREGVLYVPGDYCFVPDAVVPRNQMRLCFATVEVARIEEGVRRLARAVRAALAPDALAPDTLAPDAAATAPAAGTAP